MKIVVSVDRFDVRFLDMTPIIDHVAESKWNLLGPPGVDKAKTLIAADELLGLHLMKDVSDEEVPDAVKKLLEDRDAARAEKRWADSDSIRDAIGEMGYIVKDTKEGQKVEKK
jgi:cysteinyl-tRNA synthetase